MDIGDGYLGWIYMLLMQDVYLGWISIMDMSSMDICDLYIYIYIYIWICRYDWYIGLIYGIDI